MVSPATISYDLLLKKAWPIILANASVPLLGLVDTSVIGNFGSAQDLGAIAFGALIFSFVYWGFGFLRMGTTGFVAQADGAGDQAEVRAILGRALLLAILLGVLLILLQWPIKALAFSLLDGSSAVERVASEYFSIRIWGAPATLCTFALMGLLIGLGNSRQLLTVQLFLNGLNVALDVYFAGILELGAQGVALGTVIAEWASVLFAGTLVYRELASRSPLAEGFFSADKILEIRAFKTLLAANLDIMIRTLVLVFSFGYFTNLSAQFGDVALAANHVLLQLVSFSAFFLDGYAFVVESLVGSAIGARRQDVFDSAVFKSTVLAAVTAAVLAVLIWTCGNLLIGLLTDLAAVRVQADTLLALTAGYVLCSFAAFQLDGIFIGASATRQMRHAAFISIAVFVLACELLVGSLQVVGLWWAMIIYVVARALALLLFYGNLRRKLVR
ncbi:MAG: MATE family efflux transporter [Pseudohongiellaceae bacterium]